jgi:hypothetical protein
MAFDPVLREAQERSTAPERLSELSKHRLIDIRIEVARNSATPIEVVRSLGADRSARVRMSVAENPAIPDDLLLTLSNDADAAVRYTAAWSAQGRPAVLPTLAESPDTTVREIIAGINSLEQLERPIQQSLALDHSREARARIAESTQYRGIFEALLTDADPRVRGRCGGNPRATRDDLEALSTDRSAVARTIAVAVGLQFPDDDQLVRLARDRSSQVQWAVIMRVGSPREAVEIVAANGDEMNRHQASAVLNRGGGNAPNVIASVMQSRVEAALLGPFI